MTDQVWNAVEVRAVVLHFYIAVSPDQIDHTKQLEYDYPWLEDKVEPLTSNYDVLGKVCNHVII